MTTPPVDIKNTQMQVQAQQMQLQQNQIGSLAKGGKGNMTPEQKEKKLRESCEGFESIFIQKMWQQMRATVPKSTLLQGKEEQFWQGMYDEELSKKMASSGGIGLADMMYEQLSRDLVSASRTTASAVGARGEGGSGFVAQAAPLLPVSPQAGKPGTELAAANPKTSVPLASNMYAGTAAQPEAPVEAEPAQVPQAQNPASPSPQGGQAQATAPNPAEGDTESSPVVQQFLAQLRQQQAQQGQQGQHAAAPEAQKVASHSVQRGQGGMTLAQRAQLDAANKPPLNGVMPAQRNARLTPPSAPQAQAQAAHAVQAAQTPQTAQAAQAAQGQNVQAQAAQPPVPTLGASPVLAEAQAFASQATAPVQPAAAAAEQQPQVVNTTFTTNVPSKSRRSGRSGQRLPSGQPLIRTLHTAPASPITNNGQQVGRATEDAPRAVQGGQPAQHVPQQAPQQGMPQAPVSPQAPQSPLTQPVAAAVPPRAVNVPEVVVPTVNAAMPLSSAAGSPAAPRG